MADILLTLIEYGTIHSKGWLGQLPLCTCAIVGCVAYVLSLRYVVTVSGSANSSESSSIAVGLYVETGKLTMGSSGSSLTGGELCKLSLARGLTAIVPFLGCCLIVCVILFYQGYRTTLQRLILYLSLALTAETAVNVMQVHSSKDGYCKAVGFLNQYALHIVLILLLGSLLYFTRQVWKSRPGRRKLTRPDEPKRGELYYEIVFVVISIVFPLTYNWIPFICKLDAYGGQPWCWLDCSKDKTVTIVLGFVPCIVVLLICTALMVFVVAVYVRWAYRFWDVKEVRGKLIHEAFSSLAVAVALLIYLMYYLAALLLCTYKLNSYGLLMPYSIILPLLRLLITCVLAVYFFPFKAKLDKAGKTCLSCFRTHNITTEHIELRSVLENSYRKSAPIRLPSTTCYPNFLEFSDEFLTTAPRPSDDMFLPAERRVQPTRKVRSATI